jgi:hypothetical protein
VIGRNAALGFFLGGSVFAILFISIFLIGHPQCMIPPSMRSKS